LRDFDYLTFDCYGTLIDWRSGIETALKKALGALPVSGTQLLDAYIEAEAKEEASYKLYRRVLADSATEVSKKFGRELDRSAADDFASSVPLWPAFGDTAEALKRLGRMGYERYILSNVDTDQLKQTVSRQGLEVDGFVTAEQTKSYKPVYGHWETFIERTGARKERILHVAQSIFHDIVPAGELGISSAWVNRYSQAIPQGVHPAFISDSLGHLADRLPQ
jgi:2-haloalkanoic acid dehalogenase type II